MSLIQAPIDYDSCTIQEAWFEIVKRGSFDMEWYVHNVIGVPEIDPLQLKGMKAQDALIKAKCKIYDFHQLTKNNNGEFPDAHCEKWFMDRYGTYPTDADEELAEKFGMSIMSGQGPGKTTFAAWSIIRFIMCFPMVKIPCTATTEDQLKNILWAEVGKWLLYKDNITGKLLVKNSEMMYFKGFDKDESGFAVIRTAKVKKDGQSETLAGFHEDFMMIVVDEASGVEEPIFKPLEGTLTGKCNFLLLIFNPTRRSGFAYNTHFGSDKKNWIRLHWNCELSTRVSGKHIKRMADKYGIDSNTYRIRVKGLPPEVDDDSLIPFEWVNYAVERQKNPDTCLTIENNTPLVFALDVARQGKNKSVLVIRKGKVVLEVLPYYQLKSDALVKAVLLKMKEYEFKFDACFVDVIGVGGPVFDFLEKYAPGRVFPVNVAERSDEPDRFYRKRDQLWWKTRETFEKNLIAFSTNIKEDIITDMVTELSEIKYNADAVSAGGKIKVEGKDSLKSRGIESPDYADALVMSLSEDDTVFMMSRYQMDRYEKAYLDDEDEESYSENGWLLT